MRAISAVRSVATSVAAVFLLAARLGAEQGPVASDPKSITPSEVRSWTTIIGGREYSVRTATPTYDGDTGLLHLPSAYLLPQGRFAASLFRDNLDRDPKDLDISVHGFTLAYGATSRLELFASMGLQNRVNADAYTQPGFFNDLPFAGTAADYPSWQTGVGDLVLGAKLGLLDDYGDDPLGLAVRGFLKVPTAEDEAGLGTGTVSGGVDLLASKRLGTLAAVHAALGYRANADPEGVEIGNALRWGLGIALPACRLFELQAELIGTRYDDAGFPQTNPVDLVVGPVVWLRPGLFIRPAVSWNLAFDDRGLGSSWKSYTGRQIAIGFHPGGPCCPVATPVPAPPPPPPPNRLPTVACRVESPRVLIGEEVRCSATASDPDGDTLSYRWTADAGSIRGDGKEAIFDSRTVATARTVTISVEVSDGRGGTAEARCSVELVKPRPEPVTCISGGFPRNLARLNNVDKACLDDVALRLQQEPGSRVVVLGHADAAERYPEVMARKRGETVREYLVQERGIDDARVAVQSAGAERPLASGTTAPARARNRRVEVIFLAEGAVLPDQIR